MLTVTQRNQTGFIPILFLTFVFSSATSAVATARDTTDSFSAPVAPLVEVIAEISEFFSVDVVSKSGVMRGVQSAQVRSAQSAIHALRQAVDGSDLVVSQSANGTFVISVSPATQGLTQNTAPRTNHGEAKIEEVIVLGRKQPIALQNTVESVEVFSADRLDRENLFDISDALARTPNVSIFGDDINSIAIRGIARRGTSGAGQGQAINVFQDGVPLSSDTLLFGGASTWDLEQLEVLRGSQSTVQGRNSIAGAIVLQSKEPSFDWEGAARVRVAEFGTLQTAAAISGPLVADQLAFRLSADYQEFDGFIDDGFTGERVDFRESLTLRGRLLIQPEAISGLSALLTVEYNDRPGGNQPSATGMRGDLDFDLEGYTTFFEREVVETVEAHKFIADLTYSLNSRATFKLLGTFEDVDGMSEDNFRTQNRFADIGLASDRKTTTYSAEARAEFDFGNITGSVGGFYFSTETDDLQSQTNILANLLPFSFEPADSVLAFGGTVSTDVENFAFFTSWRYQTDEKWVFDAAIRYDDERFTTQSRDPTFSFAPDSCIGAVPGFIVGLPTGDLVDFPCELGAPFFLAPPEPLQSDSLSVLLPSGSITYKINEDLSAFLGYRRGYRAGGTFLSNSLQSDQLFRVNTFDPEFLDTVEAGWRAEWPNRRLRLNGTLFYSEYEDQQIRFIDDEGFPITDNAGATSLYGLELFGEYQATSTLEVFASLGLLETNVDEFVIQQDDPATPENEFLDLAGNELDRSPSVSLNVGVEYRSPNGVFASVSANYQSEYFSDIFNLDESTLDNGLTERIDATTIVNAQVGYDFGDALVVTVYANNLFDERTPETVNIGGANAALGFDDLSNAILFSRLRQPQTFGISLSSSF
ncbi:MAG: TonB-dependent receptor [Pseudomonadota bacterium]